MRVGIMVLLFSSNCLPGSLAPLHFPSAMCLPVCTEPLHLHHVTDRKGETLNQPPWEHLAALIKDLMREKAEAID